VLEAHILLRTQLPGRIQVLPANGRNSRLGGDAVARLGHDGVDLENGQIIAWVNPGSKGSSRLRIRTRVAPFEQHRRQQVVFEQGACCSMASKPRWTPSR
jgi:hypothetical protein